MNAMYEICLDLLPFLKRVSISRLTTIKKAGTTGNRYLVYDTVSAKANVNIIATQQASNVYSLRLSLAPTQVSTKNPTKARMLRR